MTRMVDSEVIDRLFERLNAVYGASWDRSMGTAPLSNVKTTWSDYLSGFDVDDISYALDKLTEKVPSVLVFRDLCRSAPKKEMPRLEAPKMDPLRMAEEIAKQVKVKEAMQKHRYNPKEWAPKIIARHQAGEKISPAVLKMARDTIEGWQP